MVISWTENRVYEVWLIVHKYRNFQLVQNLVYVSSSWKSANSVPQNKKSKNKYSELRKKYDLGRAWRPFGTLISFALGRPGEPGLWDALPENRDRFGTLRPAAIALGRSFAALEQHPVSGPPDLASIIHFKISRFMWPASFDNERFLLSSCS